MRARWLVLGLVLAACKQGDPQKKFAVAPVVVRAAAGADALALSPDGQRLAVQRCVSDRSCTVEVLRLPEQLEAEPTLGSVVGWVGDRLLMVRASGSHIVVFDDQGTTREVAVEPGELRGAACGGDWCALSYDRGGIDVVSVHWPDGKLAVIASRIGNSGVLYAGGKPNAGIAVDRERPIAYVVVDAPRELVAIALDSGAELWRTRLLDTTAYSSTTPFVVATHDGRSLLVLQTDRAYGVFEPVKFEAINASDGARTGSSGGTGQITDLAAIGSSSVVLLRVREPHAHSGGYSHWVGTDIFAPGKLTVDQTSLRPVEWRAPRQNETGFYPRAFAVTSAGVILVAMER